MACSQNLIDKLTTKAPTPVPVLKYIVIEVAPLPTSTPTEMPAAVPAEVSTCGFIEDPYVDVVPPAVPSELLDVVAGPTAVSPAAVSTVAYTAAPTEEPSAESLMVSTAAPPEVHTAVPIDNADLSPGVEAIWQTTDLYEVLDTGARSLGLVAIACINPCQTVAGLWRTDGEQSAVLASASLELLQQGEDRLRFVLSGGEVDLSGLLQNFDVDQWLGPAQADEMACGTLCLSAHHTDCLALDFRFAACPPEEADLDDAAAWDGPYIWHKQSAAG